MTVGTTPLISPITQIALPEGSGVTAISYDGTLIVQNGKVESLSWSSNGSGSGVGFHPVLQNEVQPYCQNLAIADTTTTIINNGYNYAYTLQPTGPPTPFFAGYNNIVKVEGDFFNISTLSNLTIPQSLVNYGNLSLSLGNIWALDSNHNLLSSAASLQLLVQPNGQPISTTFTCNSGTSIVAKNVTDFVIIGSSPITGVGSFYNTYSPNTIFDSNYNIYYIDSQTGNLMGTVDGLTPFQTIATAIGDSNSKIYPMLMGFPGFCVSGKTQWSCYGPLLGGMPKVYNTTSTMMIDSNGNLSSSPGGTPLWTGVSGIANPTVSIGYPVFMTLKDGSFLGAAFSQLLPAHTVAQATISPTLMSYSNNLVYGMSDFAEGVSSTAAVGVAISRPTSTNLPSFLYSSPGGGLYYIPPQ